MPLPDELPGPGVTRMGLRAMAHQSPQIDNFAEKVSASLACTVTVLLKFKLSVAGVW